MICLRWLRDDRSRTIHRWLRHDGAELGAGLLPIGFHVGFAPSVGVIEQLMLDAFLVLPADTERNGPRHISDDGPDLVGERRERRIEAHRHVAAASVRAERMHKGRPPFHLFAK